MMEAFIKFYLLSWGLLIAALVSRGADIPPILDLVETCRGAQTSARLSHLNGLGAHGYLEPLPLSNIGKYTKLLPFSNPIHRTPIFLRLSNDHADDLPDGKGFSVRFYTDEGLWDMIGTHIPIFPLSHASNYPNFIASITRDPETNQRDSKKFWTFFTQSEESLLYILLLFSHPMADIPSKNYPTSLQSIDGAGMHTFRLTNDQGTNFWARFYYISDQKVDQNNISFSTNFNSAILNMYESIEDKKFQSWTMNVQIMTQEQLEGETLFNPFDITRVWPIQKYPYIPIGKLVLNRNPDDYSEIDKVAFTPAHVIPGIQLPSQNLDTLLGLRITAYSQVQSKRLGSNYHKLSVNGLKYRPRGRVCGASLSKNKEEKKSSPFMTASPGVNNVHHQSGLVQAQKLYETLNSADQTRLATNLARRLEILKSTQVRQKIFTYVENASPKLVKDIQNILVFNST